MATVREASGFQTGSEGWLSKPRIFRGGTPKVSGGGGVQKADCEPRLQSDPSAPPHMSQNVCSGLFWELRHYCRSLYSPMSLMRSLHVGLQVTEHYSLIHPNLGPYCWSSQELQLREGTQEVWGCGRVKLGQGIKSTMTSITTITWLISIQNKN